MKLYRIRRKSDGKFFGGFLAPWAKCHRGKVHWVATGAFFKQIDTIAWHLENLTSEWNTSGRARLSMITRQITASFPERLDQYEVVVNDVTINGEEIIQATDLVKK